MYRTFIGLVLRYGDRKRNSARRIRLLGHDWQVPDTYSFIWQFREIFTDRSYAFPCTHPNPVIYDCGSNIGLSILYYNKNYPNCRIESFEPNPTVADILRPTPRAFGGAPFTCIGRLCGSATKSLSLRWRATPTRDGLMARVVA